MATAKRQLAGDMGGFTAPPPPKDPYRMAFIQVYQDERLSLAARGLVAAVYAEAGGITQDNLDPVLLDELFNYGYARQDPNTGLVRFVEDLRHWGMRNDW